jgi:hypothetical protein
MSEEVLAARSSRAIIEALEPLIFFQHATVLLNTTNAEGIRKLRQFELSTMRFPDFFDSPYHSQRSASGFSGRKVSVSIFAPLIMLMRRLMDKTSTDEAFKVMPWFVYLDFEARAVIKDIFEHFLAKRLPPMLELITGKKIRTLAGHNDLLMVLDELSDMLDVQSGRSGQYYLLSSTVIFNELEHLYKRVFREEDQTQEK